LTGHEARNADHLASTGAALLADSAAGALAQADRLLRDPQARVLMRDAARRAARPNAASLIADHVMHAASFTPYALRFTPHVDHPSLSTL
jgi:UDP-N-acetylglucosamine:LPS N-acetylglucosamine transferase